MKSIFFLIFLTALLMAEVVYVELPHGLTAQDIKVPNASTSREINSSVQSQLENYPKVTRKYSDEVYLVVLTEGGNPILPFTQGLIQNDIRSHLSLCAGNKLDGL